MKINIEVSVIMPVYNGEKYLAEAIESILNQTMNKLDYELIIVDDASADKSYEIAKSYYKDYFYSHIIHVIQLKKNKGHAYCRNKAMKIANGKYIANLDADDVAFPNRLEEQYKLIEETKADVVYSGWTELNIGVYHEPMKMKDIFHHNPLNHSTTMIKKECYKYNEDFRYAPDYELWLRLYKEGKKFVSDSKILIEYRIHNKSITCENQIKQLKYAEKARMMYK